MRPVEEMRADVLTWRKPVQEFGSPDWLSQKRTAQRRLATDVGPLLDERAEAETQRDVLLAALHVALRYADGSLDGVSAEDRATELLGCWTVLDALANGNPGPVAEFFHLTPPRGDAVRG